MKTNRQISQQKWRAKIKSRGLCTTCGKVPTKIGCTRCQSCITRSIKIVAIRRKEKIRLGICDRCPNKLFTKTLCFDCKEKLATRYRTIKQKVFDHYGWKCQCCNETTPQFLCIDHIDNSGSSDRKKTGNGSNFYKYIVDNSFPTNLRTLCQNCNFGRQLNGGICPHETSPKH